MPMKIDDKKSIIKYRIEKSAQTMIEARRSAGDYDDLFNWTEEKVTPLFEPTETLLEKMKQLITL